jgi:mannan endo-1,4-beta-mannosidase
MNKSKFLLSLLTVSILMAFSSGCSNDDDTSNPDSTTDGTTFKVKGRFLTDPCGDTVILKGVNKMSVFDENDPNGSSYFPEIAKTKSNSVRIVWQTVYSDGSAAKLSQLEALILNCINQKMIPMVEMHDATCDFGNLSKVVDYWTQTSVVQLIQKYEYALLINIANEAGDDGVTAGTFEAAYKDAITKMRTAGIKTPLVIDATGCGKDLDILVPTAANLIQHDPEHNILFSVHPYWSKLDISLYATPTFIKDQLAKAVTNNIPLILGEICAVGGYPGSNDVVETCSSKGSIDYNTLINEATKNKMGWYAWEWGPGNGFYEFNPPVMCPAMDITTNGTYQSILNIKNTDPNAWAKDAVIDNINSIQKTASKTKYLSNGFKCN